MKSKAFLLRLCLQILTTDSNGSRKIVNKNMVTQY